MAPLGGGATQPAPTPGRVNEDRVVSAEVATDCGAWSVFAVLDGHGGGQAVTAVSQQLPTVMRDGVNAAAAELGGAAAAGGARSAEWAMALEHVLTESFARWDEALRQSCTDQSGVCLTACLSPHDPPLRAVLVHLGDCRAVLSDAKGARSKALTRDHQLDCNPGERERVRASGCIAVGGRVCGLEPTRTLGDHDVKGLAPGAVSAAPEVLPVPFDAVAAPPALPFQRGAARGKSPSKAGEGDALQLILATDGLWCVAKAADAAQTAARALSKAQHRHPQGHQDAGRACVDLARRRGSYDDCSVAVVTFPSQPSPGLP